MPRIGLTCYNEPRICPCKIEFDMVGGSLLAGNMVEVCPFHATHFAQNGHLATVARVLAHSRRWQRFFNDGLAKQVASCGYTLDDGSGEVIWRSGTVTWTWVDDQLLVTFAPSIWAALTQQQKNRISTLVDAANGLVTVTNV